MHRHGIALYKNIVYTIVNLSIFCICENEFKISGKTNTWRPLILVLKDKRKQNLHRA